MRTPYLTIDLDKIEHNARSIFELCSSHGIEVAGVTKCVCGHPEVAEAMVRAGIVVIADSRLENIGRLKTEGVAESSMLLRIPALSAVDQIIESVDISLNSELPVLDALSRAAQRRGRIHDVILMIDLGDLREGIWPDDVVDFVGRAVGLSGIRIKGLGANLACLSGVVPTRDNMEHLVEFATSVERRFGIVIEWISGANSSGLSLLAAGGMPRRINHARIGEAILLGRETVHREPWAGTYQDAFALHAEILELKYKPSVPCGEFGEDAFGEHPNVEERGEVLRALLNVGRQDVDVKGIEPLDPRVTILGSSSDYLVVDATGAAHDIRVGDELIFSVNYRALLAAMTSDYVNKYSHRAGGAGTCS